MVTQDANRKDFSNTTEHIGNLYLPLFSEAKNCIFNYLSTSEDLVLYVIELNLLLPEHAPGERIGC